ncbi:hypothetical protein QUA35_14870 [Microcoleus sp. N9_B2]
MFKEKERSIKEARSRLFDINSLSGRENFKGGESSWNCDRSPVY